MSQRHLIECHCILPIYKNKKPVVYHKFSVYSKLDEKTGKVIPKYVNCNNCGITHFVTEFCKSEIKVGKEDVSSVRNVKDIRHSIPENILKILEENNATIDIYEEVEDVIDSSVYPKSIVLSREILGEDYHYKILNIKSEKKYKVQSEIINTTVFKEE